MSNTKHTPGPWTAEINKKCLAEHEINNESGQMGIAKVMLFDGDEQTIANAKLIAAAPELLFQVEQAKMILEIIDPENPAIRQMEAALKKATE